MSRDKIPTMENDSCFLIGTREEGLDAVSCLRGDGINTSSYVRIREKEERDTRKFVYSEKSHWLTTKMNMRRALTIFFSESWNHRKNSQSYEESGGFDFAEKSFHRLDADIFFHALHDFIESSLHLRISASDWFEELIVGELVELSIGITIWCDKSVENDVKVSFGMSVSVSTFFILRANFLDFFFLTKSFDKGKDITSIRIFGIIESERIRRNCRNLFLQIC